MTTTVAFALLMRVGDRACCDVVVVGSAGEAPRIAGVRAGVGVRRVAHVDRADRGPASRRSHR